MLTILSCTNRNNSNTEKFTLAYTQLLSDAKILYQILNLKDLPIEFFSPSVFDKTSKPGSVINIQETYFNYSKGFVFIMPEYNGSFPGILKLLIDSLEPKSAFSGKKAALIGVSTGRAGNLRGLDHFTAVLNHMNVAVMPFLLPISKVQFEFNEDGSFKESTLIPVNKQIDMLKNFLNV